ncbi:MAG: beta-propeller domain-containing protein [Fusicatenibacter sp.]
MDEKKLLDMLRASGEDVPIPESLEPEQIKKKLMESAGERKEEETGQEQNQAGRKPTFRIRKKCFGKLSYAAMAAAAVLVVGIGYQLLSYGSDSTAGTSAQLSRDSATMDGEEKADHAEAGDVMEETAAEAENETAAAKETDTEEASEARKKFDEEYETAGSYEKLKERLEEYEKRMQPEEPGWFERVFGGLFGNKGSSDWAYMESGAADAVAATEEAAPTNGMNEYSETNVQTEGVDEGDLVKTDGKYLYLLKNSRILIYDIQNGLPELVGKTPYLMDSAAAQAIELYVDGDRLVVIMRDNSPGLVSSAEEEDVYWIEDGEKTRVFTYDISDRANPRETGSLDVDGSYQTSRRTGDYLYLFTNYYMVTGDGETGILLPKAGNRTADASDIYLPKSFTSEQCLVIAAVDLRKPDDVTDMKIIFTFGDEPYVSTSHIYLKREQYQSINTTMLIQFGFKNGKITPGGAASVIGSIRDTFAINEYEDTLRVLTTAWVNDEEENFVTVLDANTMGLLGKVEGIAKGEQIYSARFMGKIGYFVTYRNMDPLFAVDFSDPSDPRMISELKVTGFSEYLHFWGDTKLLGIGYETDPDDGTRMGVKLSMFDISDPYHITEADKIVLKDCAYTSAADNYKGVLIDEKRDLIAFSVMDNYQEENLNLMVYSYREKGAFQQLLAEPIGSGTGRDIRSLYAGNTMYVIGSTEIYAYDMENGYAFIGKVSY